MTINRVYLVTTGQYSDYGVDSIHLDPLKAAEKAGEGEESRVEVYPIGDLPLGTTSRPRRPLKWRQVYMTKKGQVVRTDVDYGNYATAAIWPGKGVSQEVECLVATVLSTSDEHAKQIVDNLRERIICLALWISPLRQEQYLIGDYSKNSVEPAIVATMCSGEELK